MNCPKCQKDGVKSEVPAAAKANVCPDCGWLEIAYVAVGSGMTSYEKMSRADTEQKQRAAPEKRSTSQCVLCGKSREAVKKLILGVYGGVCLDCVALCQDIIEKARLESERVKTAQA